MIAEIENTSETRTIEDIEVDDWPIQKDNTVYLSGPVRLVDDDGREWRENVIDDFGNEFDFINPLDTFDPETHDILSDPKNFNEDSEKEQILPSEYVLEDKLGIMESQFVFLGLPEVIARGSMMEVMFAYRNDIPFFVWTMDGQTESGWLFNHAEYMDDDRDAVIDAMRNHE